MIFPKNTVLFYTFTSLLWLSDFFSGILEILLLSLALAVLSIWLYLLNLINLSLNINWTHLTLKRVWLFILLQLDYFLFGFIIHWLSLLLYISHGFFQFYFIFNLDFLDVLISPWLIDTLSHSFLVGIIQSCKPRCIKSFVWNTYKHVAITA